YFDVRAAREATGWVLAKVIQPEQQRDCHLAAKLKFASAGGAAAARAILDAESRLSLRQGETLFDKKIRLHLKFDEAAQGSLDTDRKQLFFIRRQAELMHREKRLRLAERRLEQKCQEALRVQQLAERRLELRAQRDEQRAAQAASRQAERTRKRAERQAFQFRLRADSLARDGARQERKRAAQERAATSALAQLRWEYSAVYGAARVAEQPDSLVHEEVERLSGLLPQRLDPTAEVIAGTDDAVDGGWQGDRVPAVEEEL